jgi:hypothetical protein
MMISGIVAKRGAILAESYAVTRKAAVLLYGFFNELNVINPNRTQTIDDEV